MTPITDNAHDNSPSSRESNPRADTSQGDTSERLADTHRSTPMDELRAIVGKVGGPQEARRLLADGSQQPPSINPRSHAESLTALVDLLAEQHSAQELGTAQDGE
ncbi:hypothetical protein EKJ_01840 [Qipengyuania flava]|uniref:Uncharacterized protein n=1 Tax=Qipengyuania flava TaxID=192812 RepID=A0A3T1CEE8_9SPHN|nr:hypothetical protein EKJ_01840 [Qipengyuania flava]